MAQRMGIIRTLFGPSKAEVRADLEHAKSKLRFGGASASGVPRQGDKFIYEHNDDLNDADRLVIYDRMLNDPHVFQALRNVTMPLRTTKWQFQSASDSDIDLEVTEFLAANLLHQSSEKFGPDFFVREPWKAQRLPEILTMLSHGFAIFKKVWKRVEGKVVYDRLQWLEPSSIDPRGFKLDAQDNIIEVLRTYNDPSMGGRMHLQEPMLPEEIALYVWGLVGARYEGTPFLRPMYGPWWRNDKVNRWTTIGAQKFGCPVPVVHYAKSDNDDQRLEAIRLAKAMRGEAPAEAYAAFEMSEDGSAAKAEYIGLNVQNIDRMRGIINGNNADIAHAGGAKAPLLGETTTGTRNAAESIGVLEMVVPEAVAETIAEQESAGVANIVGVIRDLVSRNYVGIKEDPTLTVPKINIFEKRAIVAEIADLMAAKVLPVDENVGRQIADWFGLDPSDESWEMLEKERKQAQENEKKIADAAAKPDPEPDDGQPPRKGEPTPQGGKAPAADKAGKGKGSTKEGKGESMSAFQSHIEKVLTEVPASAGRFRRNLTALEANAVDLEGVLTKMGDGEDKAAAALAASQQRMIEELLTRVRVGLINHRNLESQSRSRYNQRNADARVLQRVLDNVAKDGIDDVDSELKAQGV